MANNEQNHLAKYIKEFKGKARPQDSYLKRVKETYQIVQWHFLKKNKWWMFKAFESGIFQSLDNHSNQNNRSNQNNQAAIINIIF